MSNSTSHDERFAKMTFASVYPLYTQKVERKGRTREELNRVIEWLTGFNDKKIEQLIKDKVTFETFFQQASLNPNATLITGVICGYRVEEIENPLTQKVRYLDKLVDELAKGRKDGENIAWMTDNSKPTFTEDFYFFPLAFRHLLNRLIFYLIFLRVLLHSDLWQQFSHLYQLRNWREFHKAQNH